MKKNRTKYLPIPNRGPPTTASVILAPYVLRKLDKGHYVPLWWFTNAGIAHGQTTDSSIDEEALVPTLVDGTTAWIPAAATKTASTCVADKDLTWEDFSHAVVRFIAAIETAGWPNDRIMMFAQFFGKLQIHPNRLSPDPSDNRSLLHYMGDQRSLWHTELISPRGPYDISQISEDLLLRTRERIFNESRRLRDAEYAVSLLLSSRSLS